MSLRDVRVRAPPPAQRRNAPEDDGDQQSRSPFVGQERFSSSPRGKRAAWGPRCWRLKMSNPRKRGFSIGQGRSSFSPIKTNFVGLSLARSAKARILRLFFLSPRKQRFRGDPILACPLGAHFGEPFGDPFLASLLGPGVGVPRGATGLALEIAGDRRGGCLFKGADRVIRPAFFAVRAGTEPFCRGKPQKKSGLTP